MDQAAVAAEARPFAAGAQLLQLARTDAEVMGRLRGVEIGTPRRPQTICIGRHCFSRSCNFARQGAYRDRMGSQRPAIGPARFRVGGGNWRVAYIPRCRSEVPRVGKEWGRECSTRWVPYP